MSKDRGRAVYTAMLWALGLLHQIDDVALPEKDEEGQTLALGRARLFDFEMRKRMEEQQKLEDTKTDVGWGHQIRSYVLDQSRIKDLRTNLEISNTQKVLDGDLDPFIEASLKQGV